MGIMGRFGVCEWWWLRGRTGSGEVSGRGSFRICDDGVVAVNGSATKLDGVGRGGDGGGGGGLIHAETYGCGGL